MRGPAIHIVLADAAAQALHAGGLLLFRHLQAAMDGIGELLDVVRIDEQRVGELVSGAGKRAEDENATLVFARGDEFLGIRWSGSAR